MNYALLPFSRLGKLDLQDGLPDLRETLAHRKRTVSRNSIDNLHLIDLVVESLRELPWTFSIDHCHEENGQLHLAVVARDLARGREAGDEVNAGFYLQNSESGDLDTLVCSRLFRVVCWNGALIECSAGQTYSIGMKDSPPRDWQFKMRNVISSSFRGEGLDIDVARFRATIEQTVMTPYEFLCNLVSQRIITEDEQCDIQAAFMQEADFSMYGLINAVTFVAHHLRRNDYWLRAFQMERLGGEILRGDHNLPTYTPVYV